MDIPIPELLGLLAGGGALGWVGKAAVARFKARAAVERSGIVKEERIGLALIKTEAEREQRTEEKLWERLETVEAETKACEEGRAADRDQHDEQRRRDREQHELERKHDKEECDRRVAEVETRVSRLAVQLLEYRRLDAPFGEETTDIRELEAIARRTPLPEEAADDTL